jgi:hypothetical protein
MPSLTSKDSRSRCLSKMIYPYNDTGTAAILGKEDLWICVPQDQECTKCGELIPQHEQSIRFSWSDTSSLYFHPWCAEAVALMILRDVAEIRAGPDLANAIYQELRDRRGLGPSTTLPYDQPTN